MSQQPDNHTNLMVAIFLSLAVMVGWQYFVAGPKMKQEQARIEREKQEQAGKQPAAGTPPVSGAPTAGSTAAPPATGPTSPSAVPAKDVPAFRPSLDREAALKASPRLPIETPSLKGSIALKGGHIDDLKLAKYHETVDPQSPHVVLFSPSGAPEPYFVEYGWVPQSTSQAVPVRDTVWKAEHEGQPLTPELRP